MAHTRGPVPSRSEERIGSHHKQVPIEKVTAIGVVAIPELDIEDPHPIVTALYESLRESAQSRFYEPSDWQYARFAMHFANLLLHSARPSAHLLVTVNAALSSLLVSEGDRRRVQMEVERNKASGVVVDVAQLFRERLNQRP